MLPIISFSVSLDFASYFQIINRLTEENNVYMLKAIEEPCFSSNASLNEDFGIVTGFQAKKDVSFSFVQLNPIYKKHRNGNLWSICSSL